MADERMLNDEILLGLIKANSGGGGGGTTDYDDLNNKPQIGGVTLSGNKSASDLGLATTTDLAGKQDTLTFDDVPTTNSNNPVKSGGVKSAIDAAVASAYHHAGTKTCAELVAGLLVAGNEGNVYNMTDSGTTTADFIEGAGQPIKAGDNVGIAKISDGVYKFDLLSGFVDTTNFVQKSVTAGLLKNDGTVDTTIQGDVATLKSGLTNKVNVNGQNIEMVSFSKRYGDEGVPINIDTLNNQNGYLVCVFDGAGLSGTKPQNIGSIFLLMGLSQKMSTSDLIRFGVQIAIGFGNDTIAIRHRAYTDVGGTWGEWKYFTAS